jgi:hypothetical protein
MRILKEGFVAASLAPARLSQLKGSDPRKVAIARVISQNTTMSQSWIAEKLSMRSAANLIQQIRRSPQADKKLPK